MRTIRVELDAVVPDDDNPLVAVLGLGSRFKISTEVILGDDTEDAATLAGREARHIIDSFLDGYTNP